jgi:hypothetical protein
VSAASGSFLRRLQGKFDTHHDFTSSVRQRAIADLACVVSLTVLGIYFLAIGPWGWELTIPSGAGIAIICLWCLGLTGMVLCSSLPGVVARVLRQIGEGPAIEGSDEPDWLTRVRKYLYYPSAFATFLATAIGIEVSGGLVNSPFTSVFFGGILGAQQLSRYRLSSMVFILFGVLSSGLMALYEAAFGVPDQPPAPPELGFFALAASFLLAAICTHVAKPTNYQAKGQFPPPTHAELYRVPSENSWRFSLHHGGTRLDTTLDLTPGSSAQEAEDCLTAIVLSLCVSGQHRVEWHTEGGPERRIGYVRKTT